MLMVLDLLRLLMLDPNFPTELTIAAAYGRCVQCKPASSSGAR